MECQRLESSTRPDFIICYLVAQLLAWLPMQFGVCGLFSVRINNTTKAGKTNKCLL